MMTPTLNRISSLNLFSHEREDLLLSSDVFIFEFVEVLSDEGDVFDGFHETPDAQFFVSFLLVALSNGLILSFADPEERSAMSRNFKFLGVA